MIDAFTENQTTTIRMPEEFNFHLQREFRTLYTGLPTTNHFLLDFSRVSMVDSSALGMLLLLREYCGNEQAHITIAHCSPNVQKLFQIAQFAQLFRFA